MVRFPDAGVAIADLLDGYECVVEIGIGRRTDVASALVERGVSVIATDVHPRRVPDGVRFVRDDVADPDLAVYADADALYALNLPPELHRPARDLARQCDAEFHFTTLGGDQPEVPVRRRTVRGDTLYTAREGTGGRS